MKRRTYITLSVGGLVAAAGCYALAERGDLDIDDPRNWPGDEPGTETETPTDDDPDAGGDPAIDIRDVEFVPGTDVPGDEGSIQFTVDNVGGEPLASVDLNPEFAGSDGVPSHLGGLSLANLDPGESWTVRYPYPGSGSDVADHVVNGSFVPGTTVTDPGDVELQGHHLTVDDCHATVTGACRNVGSRTLPYVQALVKFYDADGVVVGGDYGETRNLDAGGRWEFTVAVDVESLVRPPSSHTVQLSGAWW